MGEIIRKPQLGGKVPPRLPPPDRPTGPTGRPSRPPLPPTDVENQRVKDGYLSFRELRGGSASLTHLFFPPLD